MIEPFAVLEQIRDALLKKGAQEVVLAFTRGRGKELKFVNNKIIKISNGTSESAGVFAVFDKKIVLTNILSFDPENIKKCIADIEAFSKHLEPKPDYFGIAKGPFKYSSIENIYDPKISEISEKEILELASQGIDAALQEGAKRTGGILEIGEEESFLLTSGDVKATEKSTSAYFSIRALLDKTASGHATVAETNLQKLDTTSTGHVAGKFSKMAKGPKKIEPGKYDVLFSPLAFAALLEFVGGALSIYNVEVGLSPFANKIGQQIAPKFVNLYDDGRLPGGLGSSICDAEGVPTQRTQTIDAGVLKSYLYNTSYAKKYNTKSTANAGLIAPRPTNIILEPGKSDVEDLIKDIKRGIYITNLWYTRFQNYFTGDFSTIPRDATFLIENGELKPIKEIRLSDNILKLLQNISGIARDQRQILSWEVGTPTWCSHVAVRNLNITKPVGA